jgi:hypothetical protein
MSARVAALIWFLVAQVPLALAALGLLEAYLYWTGRAKITTYIRELSVGPHLFAAYAISAALIAGAGAAFTHFVLDR